MRQFLVELFVSPSARHDDEAVERILRTVLFGLSMAIWAPIFAPLYLLAGARWAALTMMIGALVCVLLLFALRWGAAPGLMAQLLVGLLFSVLSGISLLTGGIAAPALTWLCSIPIVAVLLAGRWSGLCWMVISMAAAGGFFAMEQAGLTLESEATPAGEQWLYVASLCGIVGCATLLTGIFRRAEREARIQVDEARHVADEANRAKGDFLAKMSHEIRTPMNGVIGMAELALTTDLTDEQRNYIEAAKESAEGLLEVVNDILDYSRMEAGKLELRLQGFRIRDTLRRTMTLLSVRADPDEVSVSWHVDEDVPDVFIGDVGRLRQVLVNLVGNAIKFTPAGEVTVAVAAERNSLAAPKSSESSGPSGALSVDPPTVVLRIVVRDTGVGIAEDQQAKIFEEFEQADGSMARMFGGTGLGLSITRGLVGLMGGNIGLESRVDEGSTFTVRVPLAVGTTSDLLTNDSSVSGFVMETVRADGLRVLVVDDNRTNQVLIRGLLEKRGCDVTVSATGEAAFERTQREDFDLVFMDIEMPGMDGFETTRRIRATETDGSRLPIFALTANVLPHYGLQCLAAGMDGYLAKPLKTSELNAIIERLAATRNEAVR